MDALGALLGYRMSAVLLLLLLLVAVLVSAVQETHTINQCVLRCKDNHMRETMTNEWSADFTLPVLNILRYTGNETAAYLKVKEICASNEAFDVCLLRCNASLQSAIIRTGLASWRETCDNLEDLRTQFPCWKQFGHELSSSCFEYTIRLRQAMETFAKNTSLDALAYICSEFDDFSDCFTYQYRLHCGYRSEQFKLSAQMYTSSKEAIARMARLKFTNSTMPPSCGTNTIRRNARVDRLGAEQNFSAWLRSTSFTFFTALLAIILNMF